MEGWSAPATVRVKGGGFGLQLGVSETDVIMLVMNSSGADKMMTSKFTVGGTAEAAAGPMGRNATAETDALTRAEILSYSLSRGLFAGVALQGATLREDLDANKTLYKQRLTMKEIVRDPKVNPTPGGEKLLAVLMFLPMEAPYRGETPRMRRQQRESNRNASGLAIWPATATNINGLTTRAKCPVKSMED